VQLTRENTGVVLDSTSDFPDARERFPSWRVVPLYVRFGGESFRDYVDLGPDEFYRRLREADTLPTTSQPTPADFLAAYEELAAFERIYSLHLSGAFSGTVESARLAAAETGGRVRVVDTRSASLGIALLALAIGRLLERGTTDDEVETLVDGFRRDAELLFTVETLEFLARGGRIGRARAWAGQLLNIKPILTIRDGEIVPVKRVRGNHRAFLEFVQAFESGPPDSSSLRVGVVHAEAPEREAALLELVRRARPSATVELTSKLGPVVGTHAGPGTVGMFWWNAPV